MAIQSIEEFESTDEIPQYVGAAGLGLVAGVVWAKLPDGSLLLLSPGFDNGITQLTGDGTAGPGSGSQALTLAESGVTPATYPFPTSVTVDAKGRVTAAVASAVVWPTSVPAGRLLFSEGSNAVGSSENLFADPTQMGVQDSGGQARMGATFDSGYLASDLQEFAWYMQRARGDRSTPAAVQNGDRLGTWYFLGHDGVTGRIAASIHVEVEGTPGVDDIPAAIVLSTRPVGGSAPVERFRIHPNGTVTFAGGGGNGLFFGASSPEGAQTAEPGSLFLRSNGLVYRKASGSGNTGWVDMANLAALTSSTSNTAIAMTDGSGVPSWVTTVEPVMKGNGTPEGSVTADVGRLYRNTATGLVYRKQTGSGNTGWSSPISDLASLITSTSNNAMAMTNGSGVPSWVTTVEPILTNNGHPQGVVSAAVGRRCRDTATGIMYEKLGGGSTAWGWYIVRSAAGSPFMYFDYFTINGTWVGVGISNGTGTASGTQSRGFFSDGAYFQNATAASANATSTYSGDASTTSMLRTSHDWDVVFNMRTDSSSVAGTRMLIGVATTNVNLQVGAPTASGVWFRYDTVAGDTQWMGYAHDGTTLSGTTAIGAIAAGTVYKLRIRKVGNTAYLSINDGAEVTLSNNVPTSGVSVGPMMRITTTGAALALWSFYRGVSADFKGA